MLALDVRSQEQVPRGEADEELLLDVDIDIERIKAKDFMQRKESKLPPDRKLKDFYKKYTEHSEVSVFTMAENASQIKVSDLFVDPANEKSKFDS